MSSVMQPSNVMLSHTSSSSLRRLRQSWAFDIEYHHHTAINLKDELKGFLEHCMSRSAPSSQMRTDLALPCTLKEFHL